MKSHSSPVYEERIGQYLHHPSSPKSIAKKKAQIRTTTGTAATTDIETTAIQECYSRLRKLVPWVHADVSMSEVELLQHVIDYIQELQETLDSAEEREAISSDSEAMTSACSDGESDDDISH